MGEEVRKFLLLIFERLLERYGPQNWWPAETPFEVAVGAILTQATAWRNVERALENLKSRGLLDPLLLSRISEEELSELLRPSGFYREKARRVRAFANFLVERYEGSLEKLFSKSVEEVRAELLSLPGIGEETADSILLYAGGKPVFVVDSYARRIFSRLGVDAAGRSYKDFQAFFMNNLPLDVCIFNEYHALLVRHGKEVCRKNPLCERCCLEDLCSAIFK